ncbi:MAG: TIGR00730 family Rossman fold protein [SAR324 cluster bacterium]|nr:TIGR00730 family Rossman fold protein [SAR324 cluster bacterium]MBF0350236.1 TIGR00730 family Rossman fold protein [SAR324 cluster bacterium]
MGVPHYIDGYSFTNKTFLLSPEASILRSLAESLYPAYLSRKLQENQPIHPHPIPALDEQFVASREALWFRVLAETIYAEIILQREEVKHTVLCFGSARIGSKKFKGTPEMAVYYKYAEELSEKLTRWSMSLVEPGSPPPFMICSGGGPGIMEAGNRGAMNAGGRSIGLNIHLPTEQQPNPYISKEFVFNFQYFFTRKFHFLKRAKAIVVFPGGYGSLDELFETLTLIQTGKIDPVKVILFGTAFWKDILNLPRMVDHGVIAPSDLELFEYHDSVETAVQAIQQELLTILNHEKLHSLPTVL